VTRDDRVAPRFLLVRIEPDLHPSRVVGIFHQIVQTPGVEACTSAEILDLNRDQLELLGGLEHVTQSPLFEEAALFTSDAA
jgi:hypothetical protein